MNNFFKTSICAVLIMGIMTAAVAKDPKVSIKFTSEELALCINILNTIDLRGDEVMPFIDIKNLLVDEYKSVSSDKKKSVEIDFPLPMAKNFLFFMQRAKLKGAEAEIFNDICNKMIKAIKK